MNVQPATSNLAVLDYLTKAPTSEFVEQPVELLDAWEGSDNLLWKVESRGVEAVLKLYLDAGQARSRRQFDGQQMFAPLGIAPRPRWYDRYPLGLARQVLIYEWIPGDPLNATDQTVLNSLAHTLAQIHGADVAEVHRFSPNALNLDYYWRMERGGFAAIDAWLRERKADTFFSIFTRLTEQSTTLVEAALSLWAETPPTAVHGDLKLENCVSSFGQPILLDWELFGLGDPALEVATFLFISQTELEGDVQESWLDTYLASADQSGLAQRIGVYRKLLPLRSVTYLLHGLRQMDPAQDTTEIAQFLASTLHSSLVQALTSFGLEVDESNLEKSTKSLVHRT